MQIIRRYLAITSLWFISLSWEEYQLAFVFIQSLHIGLQRFSGAVLPSVVNCNTNA